MVVQELNDAIDRSTKAFEAEPEILERTVDALCGEPAEGDHGADACTPAGDRASAGAGGA